MRHDENLAADLFEEMNTEMKTEETDLAARWIPVALKEVMLNLEDETSPQL